jgi:hypothetical protein
MTMPLAAQLPSSQAGGADSKLAQQIKSEAGQVTAEYWTPKLNAYKVQIDRTLTPTDLDELNRLRARWSILLGEKLKQNADRKSSKADGAEGVEMKIDGEEAMGKLNEFMDIYTSTKEMAERYRADMDVLGERVVGDLFGFTDVLIDRADLFVDRHRAEFTEKQRNDFTARRNEFAETVKGLRSNEEGESGVAAIYSMAIEPMVMLYNGDDLKELIGQLGSISRPVAGIEIPENSTLGQNFPNPASSRTTIAYTLSEPSGSTMLRVFNASGDLVAKLDQGARPAGEGSIDLDVSGYATGSYLYQLTFQTSKGEQVVAKRMQVVR